MEEAGKPSGAGGNVDLASEMVRIMGQLAENQNLVSRNVQMKPLLKSLLTGKKFGANVTAVSLRVFIQHLTKINTVEGVSISVLLEYLPTVLEGKALEWWVANRTEIDTLPELEDGLIELYLGPDWKGKVKADFLLRTQGINETIIQYITVLNNMAACMGSTRISQDVFDRASTGLRQEYYDYFSPVRHDSLTLLLEKCREAETCMARKLRYRPPPKPQDCWAPDFAAEMGTQVLTESRTRNVQAVVEPNPMERTRQIRKCFGCNSEDHLVRNCPRLREFRNGVSGNFLPPPPR